MYQCPTCQYHLTPEGYCNQCDGVEECAPFKWKAGFWTGYGQSEADCQRQIEQFNLGPAQIMPNK